MYPVHPPGEPSPDPALGESEREAHHEVPAAALAIDGITEHVDFVSVGTNDLLQYLNAADRQPGALAELQDPFTPALLKLLAGICASARATSTRVCVCAGVASDPDWAVLAVGFGVDELSVPLSRSLASAIAWPG